MTLSLQVSLAQPLMLVKREPQTLVALIDLLPIVEHGVGAASPPANMVFVLDKSDSMNDEQKIELLREAMSRAVGLLRPEDQATVIAFNYRAKTIGQKARGEPSSALADAIRAMDAQNGTKLSEGLRAGLAAVRQMGSEPGTRLLVLTDGQTDNDEAECRDLVREASDYQVVVHAYGLGTDWNSDLLADLATSAGGTATALLTPDELDATFRQQVQASQSVVARNLRVNLSCVAGTRISQIVRWQDDTANFERVAMDGITQFPVRLGGVSAPGGARIGLELRVPAVQEGRLKLLDIDFEYVAVPGNQRTTGHADVSVTCTTDPAAIRPSDDPAVLAASQLLMASIRLQRTYQEYEGVRDPRNDAEIARLRDDVQRMVPVLSRLGMDQAVKLHEENLAKMQRGEKVLDGTVRTSATGAGLVGASATATL